MNTSGFLYLHRTAGAPDAAAEVRFRVTRDSDPKSFATGSDLIFNGVPWSEPMVRQFASCYDNLLSHEGLLSSKIQETRRHSRFRTRTVPVVFALRQPFLLDGASTSKHIEILGIEDGKIKLEYLTIPEVPDHRLARVGKGKLIWSSLSSESVHVLNTQAIGLLGNSSLDSSGILISPAQPSACARQS